MAWHSPHQRGSERLEPLLSLNVGTAPETALITRQLSHAALTKQQYYRPSLVMSMHQWPIQQWNRCTKGSRLLVRNAKPRSHYLLRSRNVAKLRRCARAGQPTSKEKGDVYWRGEPTGLWLLWQLYSSGRHSITGRVCSVSEGQPTSKEC